MYNFTVKSKIHEYNVNFIANVEDSFNVEIKESDFIIIDKKEIFYNFLNMFFIKKRFRLYFI